MNIPGNAGILHSASDRLSRSAREVERARQQLDSAQQELVAAGIWQGAAASLFTATVLGAEQDARTVTEACRRVSAALRAYADALERSQALAASLTHEAEQLNLRLDDRGAVTVPPELPAGLSLAPSQAPRLERHAGALLQGIRDAAAQARREISEAVSALEALGGRRQERRIRTDQAARNPEGGRGGSHWDTDWAGREILERYLVGGSDWIIDNDPQWSRYMMRNRLLAQQLSPRIQEAATALYAQYRATGKASTVFDETFHAEIENGEGAVGYQYLHGTDKNAGDFNIHGSAVITPTPDGYEVRVSATYTWNDIIDPNYQYSTDRWKSAIAEAITLGRADPYRIKILWPAETVIKLDRAGNVVAVEGYPAR